MDYKGISFLKTNGRVNKTVQERITEKLRYAILFGELPSGTRLLQDELAQKFGVSITPIREAIKALASEGLVKTDPYKGAMVYEVNAKEYDTVLHLRLMVETYSIQFTIENITKEEIDQLEDILKLMVEAENFEDWFGLNHSFHTILNQASRSESLIQVQNLLRNLANLYSPSTPLDQQEHMQESNEDHRNLLDACKRKDVELAKSIVGKHSQMKYKFAESDTGF